MRLRSLLPVALVLGCTGVIDGARAPGAPTAPETTRTPPVGTPSPEMASPSPSPAATRSPFSCNAGAIDPGPAPLQRLTSEQYLNTIKDLFGDIPELKTVLPAADSGGEFGLVQGDVSQVELETYQAAAAVAARAVTGKPALLAGVAPCADTDRRACARTFLQRFGTRLYRAPVDPVDLERHLALYDLGARGGDHARGIEVLLRGMLQAPRFLYRVELGTSETISATAVKLSGHEIAARLSYALWRSTPDARLTEAATRGELATKAGVAAQLPRLLQDPRGAKAVRRFLETWIGLPDLDHSVKDGKLFPQWGKTLRDGMRSQAHAFFDHVLAAQGGRLDALLTSPTVFVNRALASWYDAAVSTTGNVPIERRDGTASGLLTLTALLTTHSKPDESFPIYRGKYVREQLLCQVLPPPPADAVIEPPEVKKGQSARDRFTEHAKDPACRGCHYLIDPIGFVFESYDAIGRYRTEEGGHPVDPAAEILGTTDMNGRVAGVAELGKKMAGSVQVQACAAQQWFRYVLARFEQPVDDCTMKALYDTFSASNGSLTALPAAIVQSDAFLYRRPINP